MLYSSPPVLTVEPFFQKIALSETSGLPETKKISLTVLSVPYRPGVNVKPARWYWSEGCEVHPYRSFTEINPRRFSTKKSRCSYGSNFHQTLASFELQKLFFFELTKFLRSIKFKICLERSQFCIFESVNYSRKEHIFDDKTCISNDSPISLLKDPSNT